MGDVVAAVPDVVDDEVAADDAAVVEQEKFEEVKFFAGEFDALVLAFNQAGHAVEDDLADADLLGRGGFLNDFADEERHLGQGNRLVQENGLAEQLAQRLIFEKDFFTLVEENKRDAGADVFEEFAEQRPLLFDERVREKQGVGLKVRIVRKAERRNHQAGEVVTLERKAERGALHEVRCNNECVHTNVGRCVKRSLTVEIWEMRMRGFSI